MIAPNRWWYVVENEFVEDRYCTSLQYYRLYKDRGGNLAYDDFLSHAKSGEIDIKG